MFFLKFWDSTCWLNIFKIVKNDLFIFDFFKLQHFDYNFENIEHFKTKKWIRGRALYWCSIDFLLIFIDVLLSFIDFEWFLLIVFDFLLIFIDFYWCSWPDRSFERALANRFLLIWRAKRAKSIKNRLAKARSYDINAGRCLGFRRLGLRLFRV